MTIQTSKTTMQNYHTYTFVFCLCFSALIVMLQELIVRKEEKGTWQLSVFSRNWMVNKTGLTLQYRAPDTFFAFVSLLI